MIRNISQKQYKNNIVQKNTKKEIQQIYKLVLLLQHLDNDLDLLQEEFLVASKDDVNKNCKNKSTDKLKGEGISEQKKFKTQKPPRCQQGIQTLDEETHPFDKDFLASNKREKKKRIL
ncbi:unnamed protein product [Paramecium primaurelia]|uniref:Uncharacterized protein n=1 Tax=Paramecium primaurelia TaxID=5886 RepID=A0A8S1KJS1_PARPR|nr:unnamed protein product [Paramecium primaurelia]